MGINKGHGLGKKILRIIVKLVIVLVVVAVALALYLDYHSKHYEISFYQISSDKVSENLRIAFISDLHMREYGEHSGTLINDVAALQPDLILLGGDTVSYPCTKYDNMIELCGALTEIAPVYSVTGNHENELMYLGGDKDLIEKFTAVGVVFLDNADKTLTIGQNKVQLVGVNGGVDGFDKYGAKEEMDQLEETFDGFRIVIDHVPLAFPRKLSEYSFDMGLAGHVHGGIVRLPKLGALYSAEEGFFPEYSKGSYNLRNGAKLIVSGGLGDSSSIPLRINNNPELVVIDINWY